MVGDFARGLETVVFLLLKKVEGLVVMTTEGMSLLFLTGGAESGSPSTEDSERRRMRAGILALRLGRGRAKLLVVPRLTTGAEAGCSSWASV